MIQLSIIFCYEVNLSCNATGCSFKTQDINPQFGKYDIKMYYYANLSTQTVIGNSPNFNYDDLGNNQYIIYIKAQPINLTDSSLYRVQIINQGVVTDTINLLYQPNVAYYVTLTQPKELSNCSYQYQQTDVTVSVVDQNQLTAACVPIQMALKSSSFSLVQVTFMNCLGLVYIQNISIDPVSVSVVGKTIYSYTNASVSVDLLFYNINPSSIIPTASNSIVTISSTLSNTLQLSIFLTAPLNSLNINVKYNSKCENGSTYQRSKTFNVALNQLQEINIQYDSIKALNAFNFSTQCSGIVANTIIGTTAITCTQNQILNCQIDSNDYQLVTNSSNDIQNRVSVFKYKCDATNVELQVVFNEISKISIKNGIICGIMNTKPQYLQIFNGIDLCLINTVTNKLTVEVLQNVIKFTITSCTKVTSVFQYSFPSITVKLSSFVAVNNVSFQITANILPSDLNLFYNSSSVAKQPCDTVQKLCSFANQAKSDYVVFYSYTDQCSSATNVNSVGTVSYFDSIDVKCSGQCEISFANVAIDASQEPLLRRDPVSQYQPISSIGTYSAETKTVMLDRSKVSLNPLGRQARLSVLLLSGATADYLINYQLQQTAVVEYAAQITPEQCTAPATITAQQLRFRLKDEDCGITVSNVKMTSYDKAEFTAVNCFSVESNLTADVVVSSFTASSVGEIAVGSDLVANFTIQSLNLQAFNSTNFKVVNSDSVDLQLNITYASGNLIFPTVNLMVKGKYTIELSAIDTCGNNQTLYSTFQPVRAYHQPSINAYNCSFNRNCIYQINYTSNFMTCADQTIILTNQERNTNSTFSISGNSIIFTLKDANTIYIGELYTTQLDVGCIDLQLATFRFSDETGFTISLKTNMVCSNSNTDILNNVLQFTNLQENYKLSTIQQIDSIQIMFTTILNQQFNFTISYMQSSANITLNLAINGFVTVNSSNLIGISVSQQNIFNLKISIGAIYATKKDNGYIINTSSLNTGIYQIKYNYSTYCGISIEGSTQDQVSIGYQANIICNASTTCYFDVKNIKSWQGENVNIESVFGIILPELCSSNSYTCEFGKNCSATISLLSSTVYCANDGFANLIYPSLLSQYDSVTYRIEYNNISLLLNAELLQPASNLVISKFQLKDTSKLTNYVCFDNFLPKDFDIAFTNQPCQLAISKLNYVNYNLVDITVITCFNTTTVIKSVAFKISQLQVTNTTLSTVCATCQVKYQITAQNAKNVVLSHLTANDFYIQKFEPLQNLYVTTTIKIENLVTNENLTTFSLSTSNFDLNSKYQFLIRYDDVCYNLGLKQNITNSIILQQTNSIIVTYIESSTSYKGTLVILNSFKNISQCVDASIYFTQKQTNEKANLGSSTIQIIQNSTHWQLQINFGGTYSVNTDKSSSQTEYLLNSTSLECQSLFKDESFQFFDYTNAQVQKKQIGICQSSVQMSDLLYSNVDSCSSSSAKQFQQEIGSNLIFTQQSCLGYNFTSLSFAVAITTSQVTTKFDTDISLSVFVNSTQVVVSVSLTNATANVSCGASNDTANLFNCSTLGLSAGAYDVNILFLSQCTIIRPVTIARSLSLTVDKTGWNSSDLTSNVLYTRMTYGFTSLPATSTVQWTCGNLSPLFPSSQQLVLQSVGANYTCTAVVSTSSDSVSYTVHTTDYAAFDVSRCFVYDSAYDSRPVQENTTSGRTITLTRNQIYALRCFDAQNVELSNANLSANGAQAVQFPATSEAVNIAFAAANVGVVTQSLSVVLVEVGTMSAAQDLLETTPQRREAISKSYQAASAAAKFLQAGQLLSLPPTANVLAGLTDEAKTRLLQLFERQMLSMAPTASNMDLATATLSTTNVSDSAAQIVNMMGQQTAGINFAFQVADFQAAQYDSAQKKSTILNVTVKLQSNNSYSYLAGYSVAVVRFNSSVIICSKQDDFNIVSVMSGIGDCASTTYEVFANQLIENVISGSCQQQQDATSTTCTCKQPRGYGLVIKLINVQKSIINVNYLTLIMNLAALGISMLVGLIAIIMAKKQAYGRM